MKGDNPITNPPAKEIDLALARATLYSALGLAFRPPTETTLARLVAPESGATLTKAAGVLDPQGEAGLANGVAALARGGQVDIDAIASAHRTLFGHTVRGAVPPYETEYGSEALFQQPQEMGDLMGFYRAFGLTINGAAHERLDHISCEYEFLAFLALKEAYALERDDNETLVEIDKAQRLFLKDHLGRFLPAFARKLTAADPSGFYSIAAQLCLSFAVREGARFSISLGEANLPLRPADDDRVPMACGSRTDCTAMPGACLPEEIDTV